MAGARLHVREPRRIAPGRDPRLEPVLDAIRANIERGSAPRVSELSERFGVSDRTLLHWFRDAGLPPPRDYMLALRLERARKQIHSTNRPLADIAADCGFRKQGALSEHFKRRYGLTPRACRQQAPDRR